MNEENWPPEDGQAFIRSEKFGRWLYDAAMRAASRNPRLDFSDAFAQVYVWFDRKLKKNRRFINKRRFPNERHFRGYLHQSVKRAALQSLRKRNRKADIEPLSEDFQDEPELPSVDQLLDMLEHSREDYDPIDQRIVDWLIEKISGASANSHEIIASSFGIGLEEFEKRLGRILDDMPM